MGSLLEPVIDVEQRYAEEPAFTLRVDALRAWLLEMGFAREDAQQAMTLILHRGEQNGGLPSRSSLFPPS